MEAYTIHDDGVGKRNRGAVNHVPSEVQQKQGQ